MADLFGLQAHLAANQEVIDVAVSTVIAAGNKGRNSARAFK